MAIITSPENCLLIVWYLNEFLKMVFLTMKKYTPPIHLSVRTWFLFFLSLSFHAKHILCAHSFDVKSLPGHWHTSTYTRWTNANLIHFNLYSIVSLAKFIIFKQRCMEFRKQITLTYTQMHHIFILRHWRNIEWYSVSCALYTILRNYNGYVETTEDNMKI